MEIKKQGQILELDPTKEYWLFIKGGSLLAKAAKQGYIKRKNNQILFVGNMDEFKLVERSDKITGIAFEEDNK